ncbi:MAG: hypothetical protein H6713_42940 [Myxococcales bacterium]|nr:hypothetical protein [Myxococcales bacterium]
MFVTALCCLTFELVLARLADYHLGADNAFLALPIAFLGLALGSLHMHLRPVSVSSFRLTRELALLAGLCVGGLLFAFVFFSWIMPVTSTIGMMERLDYLAQKTAIFIVLMSAPFYSFGRVLTGVYQLRREDVGAIYAADFTGAALACAVTPLAFHFGGLPTVVLVLIVLSFVPLLLAGTSGSRRAMIAVLAGLTAIVSVRLIEWADDTVSYAEYRASDVRYEELERAWNEHSRVALLKRTKILEDGSDGRSFFGIVHNNSRSNVRVVPYEGPREARRPKAFEGMEAAWVLGRAPENILVMFAGTGAQMVRLNDLASGEATVTGVELNALVEKIGRQSEAIAHMRLNEFLALEHINLVIDEGRHFLATRPEGTKYDLIYIGCNAATTAITGHSRKYLDTVEAYERYLELLTNDGLLVFDHQPLERRLQNLRAVFEKRGITEFENKVIVVDSVESNDDLIVAPGGFSAEELARAETFTRGRYKRQWRRQLRYMPGEGRPRNEKYRELIEGARGEEATDDRPFVRNLEVDGYSLIPAPGQKKTVDWYISWIKITTVLVLAIVAAFFIVVASLKRDSRAPLPVLLYLLMTGFCFMLCEVALMAKLELFLAEPLLSMAAVLSLFLLTSGLGSWLYPRVAHLCDTRWLALLAAAIAPLCLLILDALVEHALGLNVTLKLLLSAVAIAPLGMVLGLFFPHIITCLLANNREQTVSISYGISTLSSVVGSAYALTAMINLGFSALIYQATAVYIALCVFAVIYHALGGRWLSR